MRSEADRIRTDIQRGACDPAAFRAALRAEPSTERDAWLDRVFELGELPDDEPHLPSGCVPYLPSAVDVLLRMVEQIPIGPSDVLVDIGAGVGRAAAFLHLATGASVIGIEIQSRLVTAFRNLAARMQLSRMSVVEGDAAAVVSRMTTGTVFFLYCPFSGDRLAKVVAALEPFARTKTIHVCCVDLPLPSCDWLVRERPFARDLAIYRSNLAITSSKESSSHIVRVDAHVDRATRPVR